MSNLDKILKEKVPEFEKEPSDGHFERFQAKILKQESKKRGFSFILKIAASFIFVLLSANLYWILMDQKSESRQAEIVHSDMMDAEIYYSNRIRQELNDIEKMAIAGVATKSELKEIKSEFTKMDSLYQNLKKDYLDNPNDERVLNAMNSHYQAKLEIVNTIKLSWENVKQQKTVSHENI